MNPLNSRLLRTPVIAILLLLAFSSVVSAQVNYSVTGFLNWVSGPDPLYLDQQSVSAVATLSQTVTPTSSTTTSTSSSNTYSGTGAGILLNGYQCGLAPEPAITLTDNAGGQDTITLSNCTIESTTISGSITIPAGYMISAVPAAVPLNNIVTGTVSYSLGGGEPTLFTISSGTMIAVGTTPADNPPTLIPSLAGWTPTAPLGSTIPVSQPVTFTTVPSAAYNAVSFTTSAATSDGGTWLTVTPAAANSSSAIIITVNPTGLTAPSYSGTVTVGFESSDVAPISIPVTLTLSGSVSGTQLTAPSSMTFNYTAGGAAPASQTLMIGSSPASSTGLTASVTAGNSWLTVSPGSGTTPASFTVSVSTAGLTSSQTLIGNIQIAAFGVANSPLNIPVTYTVSSSSSSSSTLTVPTTPLTFNYAIGGTAPAAQAVSITGTSGISFTTLTSGGAWLSATPSGTVPSSLSIAVNSSGLSAGTYNGTVTVSSTGAAGSPAVIPVTLTVTGSGVAGPALTASPSALTFNYQLGSSTTPQSQQINVGGPSGTNFTATAATSSGSWLSVTPSGTTPGSVSVSVDTTSLAANTYSGTITLSAPGVTSQQVSVTLVVSSSSSTTGGGITASPSSLSFAYQIGGTTPAPQSVTIGGSAGLTFTGAPVTVSGGSWLTVSPTSGTTPAFVSISVNPSGLAAATYSGTVTMSAGSSSQTVNVTLVVSNQSTMSLSASTLNFTATAGAAAPPSQTVTVSSSPSSPVAVSVAGGGWLSASVSPSSTPAVVTVSANPASLAPGTYGATVTVTSAGVSNSPQTIAVTLVISPVPVTATTSIAATPANLGFAYVLGNNNPSPQTINVTSGQPLTFSMSIANGSWLTVTNSSYSTPATLTASVNASSLAAGLYTATISITSADATNSPLLVPVTLLVSTTPVLAVSPSSLTFTAQAANPLSQSINLTGSSLVPYTVATSPSWLTVNVAGGLTPTILVASVNAQGMSQGSYPGTITITSGVATNGPLTIPVTLNVTAPLLNTSPTISAVVSAASYNASGFSPGTIVSIFGSFLGPQKGATFGVNSRGLLENVLGGATVTVGGVTAIPLFVQNGQINVILPYELGTGGQANVEVQYNNETSAGFNIPLVPADVQIFTANASGSGPGSILNQDSSVNTATNPAAPGSIVSVYGTGGGAVSPAVTAGEVASDTLSWVTLPYSATVNGETAKVFYAGTAPSLVYGVYQFNVQIPADVPAGAVTIILTVGDSTSQSDVTVFVQ
jgi:uncharacterized protein (TIGR03437 family)